MKTVLEFYHPITIINYRYCTILDDINKIIIDNENCIFEKNNIEISKMQLNENNLHSTIIKEYDNASYYISEKPLSYFVNNVISNPKNGKRTIVI